MTGKLVDLTVGRMTRRAQAKITIPMDEAIEDVARELAGDGDPSMMRSRAIRELIAAGIKTRARTSSARMTRSGQRAE